MLITSTKSFIFCETLILPLFLTDLLWCHIETLKGMLEINFNLDHKFFLHGNSANISQFERQQVRTSAVYPVPSLHPAWSGATTMRPWGCTLSCSSQPCTASANLTNRGNGYLWQSPSRCWAHMPKLRWVTVSQDLDLNLYSCFLKPWVAILLCCTKTAWIGFYD